MSLTMAFAPDSTFALQRGYTESMSESNPLVILEPKTSRVALTSRSNYYRNGIMGSYSTVYVDRHKVISHPFRDGDTVRIGGGRTPWTVEFAHEQGVALVSPKGIRRSFAYDSLTRLHQAVSA